MVKELSVDNLVAAARRVGVALSPVDVGGNLYVWHTPAPAESVVYIGKSDSENRLRNEQNWMRSDVANSIFSGIVTLLRVNRAKSRAFNYEPDAFESSRWRGIVERGRWSGPAIDSLEVHFASGDTLKSVDVEKLLVRIAVRYGVPIGNSQFASQWENPIGSISDTLAALAVYDDDSFKVPELDWIP
ncbi:hypothetical protein ACFWXB_16245 [Tsukamurella tyrosinosolvens]|uniref:hypothetical protein n=1 Tax=Tsukamurella tyrosinosolvens TaxID=57704 RepID=UPI003683F723